jgi:hypothetical protein
VLSRIIALFKPFDVLRQFSVVTGRATLNALRTSSDHATNWAETSPASGSRLK